MRNVDWLVKTNLRFIAERIAADYACDWCAWNGTDCEGKGECSDGVLEWLMAERKACTERP